MFSTITGSLPKRFRDFLRCQRNIASFSDGQARIMSWEPNDFSSLVVEVTPNGGPYKGGTYCFEVLYSRKKKIQPTNPTPIASELPSEHYYFTSKVMTK